MKPSYKVYGGFLYFIIKIGGVSMNLNIIPEELRKMETESVSCNIRTPYAMLCECLETEDEAIIEQAWLCFAEFSADHMIG